MKGLKMKRLKGFTLAEVLITLAIIGVVAAISIPSVISNSQQQEFKTGLRKAVSVLNSAITMNMAIDGESPYENTDLLRYLVRRMSVLKTTPVLPYKSYTYPSAGGYYWSAMNAAIYLNDGMRLEFSSGGHEQELHESAVSTCSATNSINSFNFNYNQFGCKGCGSYGLNHNPNNTTKPPCMILVDVNGDRKPTPGNANCNEVSCALRDNKYRVPLPSEKKLRDIFAIIITEDRAIPFGVTAQKAMYDAQK